ncbi:hypothetical protein BJY01DRAFT_250170 [Aspergillus pseudoustus]|uniref:C2H2-type domain-containing protein n=1 Tax=Aspergillus pseudoustus TaxID=1810923 RepID=A0ABR4JM61_9EURO
MPRDSFATKSHQCPRCGKEFARLEHLQHTKEKPFQCTECVKAFTRKDLLTRHGRLTHSANRPAAEESSNTLPLPATFEGAQSSGDDHANTIMFLEPQLGGNFLMPGFTASVHPQFTSDLDLGNVDPIPEPYLDEFTAFMDSIPIPSHPFSPSYQPMPTFSPEFRPSVAAAMMTQPLEPTMDVEPASEDAALEAPLSPFSSRLPSLQPEESRSQHSLSATSANTNLVVTDACRAHFETELSKLNGLIPGDFMLPSRHTLGRLIAGYFNTFHEHYPFLHIPTLRLHSLSLELFLGICAVGARYAREPEMSTEIFRVTKAVVMERMRERRQIRFAKSTPNSRASNSLYTNTRTAAGALGVFSVADLQLTQAMLLLIAVATWFNREPETYEALSIRSILDSLMREGNAAQGSPGTIPLGGENWHEWVQVETVRRTRLVVFCFFNLHTIVFDLPPMMLASELNLQLPCSEQEWKASSQGAWQKARNPNDQPPNFQAAFEGLFTDAKSPDYRMLAQFSALGGCILIHGIIQRIWLVRNTWSPGARDAGLPLANIEMFERALKAWSCYWEQDKERSIDPLSPHGPLSFTSTALLRLAYIRINMDLGPARALNTWDPHLIAQSLDRSPAPQRGDKITRAALHCTHALSIPVRLGIKFIARTQVVYWSNQHALCSLECAVMLAKWLEGVTRPHMSPPISAAEKRVLTFVAQLLAEADYRQTPDQVMQRKERMSALCVRLWAMLYDCESVWEMVDLIGQSLGVYADLLDQRYGR